MLLNKKKLILSGADKKEQEARRKILEILEFSVKSGDPFFLTQKALRQIDFGKFKNIYVIGAGKGSYRLAAATEKFLGKKITAGWVSVPAIVGREKLKKIKITLAGHPLPNKGSVLGAKRILNLIKKAGARDLVLGLFSGGASALFCLPTTDITLKDKIKTTSLLLRSGALIEEINAVRKHLSLIKGGRLAEACAKTNLVAFYLSDVVGNDLSVVASGPTVPDKSTFATAWKIIKKYNLERKIPLTVDRRLFLGKSGKLRDTPKKLGKNIKNIIIGSHKTLALAAIKKAKELGFKAEILTNKMQGNTEIVGLDILRRLQKRKTGNIIIAAGETTFKVKTVKPGGRNQQMVLVVLPKLKYGNLFLAFDSDGVDGVGPRKIGGAMASYATALQAKKICVDPIKALRENASYDFFKKVGGQIKTGYVGTNLGDIVLAINFS